MFNKTSIAPETETEDKLAQLSRAKRRIAELVARGRSNLEIAADFAITERTVKAHLTSI